MRPMGGFSRVDTTDVFICCATPILAIVFGALGLTAWLLKADYVLIPGLLICLGLVALGLYRRGVAARACCDPNFAQSTTASRK